MQVNDGRGERLRNRFRTMLRGPKAFWRRRGRWPERSLEELLDGYQDVLDEVEPICRGDAAAGGDEAIEEAWLLRDAGIARIDGAVQALGLLGFAARRGEDGRWHVGRR